jgi:hypothetical protein
MGRNDNRIIKDYLSGEEAAFSELVNFFGILGDNDAEKTCGG